MDTIGPASISGFHVGAPAPGNDPAGGDARAFNTVYREALGQAPAAREVNPRADLRTFGDNFRQLERTLEAERTNMMRVLMPPTIGAGEAHGQNYRHAAQTAPSRGGSNGFTPASTSGSAERGQFVSHDQQRLARDSDRIQPIFSDHSQRAAPVVQSALGMNGETKANSIDFAGEISHMTNRLDKVMGDLRDTISQPRPSSPEQAMEHNSRVHGLVREGDKLNTERSMMMSLHMAAHQETRVRMLSAFEHVTGMVKKINEIFNQLKQGS
ncbi:MAG: hypothetical protein JJU21_13700 [Salinarimonas sp.]|nr:hypothetical protein [Salinarimonas sp.]